MPERTKPHTHFELRYPMSPEDEDRLRHYLNFPTLPGFRSSTGVWLTVLPDGARGVDPHDAALEVDVGPGQGQGFPEPAEAVEEEAEEGIVTDG